MKQDAPTPIDNTGDGFLLARIFAPLFLLAITSGVFAASFFMAGVANEITSHTVLAQEKVEKVREISRSERTRMAISALLANRARYQLSTIEREDLAGAIVRYADQHGHDPFLLLAVIEIESSYRPTAVSHKGAVGLMQIRPFVARAIHDEMTKGPLSSTKALYDPETNVRLGSYYLAKLIKAFDGDIKLALEAYNRGPTRLLRNMKQKPVLSLPYMNKVIKARDEIMKEVGQTV